MSSLDKIRFQNWTKIISNTTIVSIIHIGWAGLSEDTRSVNQLWYVPIDTSSKMHVVSWLKQRLDLAVLWLVCLVYGRDCACSELVLIECGVWRLFVREDGFWFEVSLGSAGTGFHTAEYYEFVLDCSWNVMAHGDAREGKWRGNWRMQWVASTLHTASEHGVSSIITGDAHTSSASSRLNWRPPADLNGLVRSAERPNLVSARVPSHFNWPLFTVSLHCLPTECPHKRAPSN